MNVQIGDTVSERSDMPKTPTTSKKLTSKAAALLGRLGGAAGTKAQNRARKQNAQRAGRPRRVCTTCHEPVVGGGVHKDRALDDTCPGRDWAWQKRSEQ